MGKLRGQQQEQPPPLPQPPQQSQQQAQTQYPPLFGNIMCTQDLETALKAQESPAPSRPANPPSKAASDEHPQSL